VNVNTSSIPSATANWLTTQRRSIIARAALYLGALAVLATGVLHIQQYYGQNYSTIPTIGTLFFLNFVSAVVVAVGLVAPLGRVAGRYADAIRALFAVGGIGIAVGSLVGLFVSESSGLFGFVEHGYRPAIVLADRPSEDPHALRVRQLSASGEAAQPYWRRESSLRSLSTSSIAASTSASWHSACSDSRSAM